MTQLIFPFRRSPFLRTALAGLSLAFGVAVLPAVAQAPASPDILTFVNGDQLTGKLERGVGDSIVFKSDMTGEITVPLSKVKELRSTSDFAVLRKGIPVTKVRVVPGNISVGENGNIVLKRPNAPVETIPSNDLSYLIDADTYNREIAGHHKFTEGWNGAVTGGITLIRATQNGSSYNAGIAITRTMPTVPWLPPRSRTIFGLTETYGKLTQPVIPPTFPSSPESVTKTNIFHAGLEQDQYLNSRFFVLGIATFDHNYGQGLNLAQLYGGGFGWTVIKSPVQEFDVTANVHYERQAFQNNLNNQNLIGATVGENYLRNLPHKIVFTETGSFLPAFNNSNAYAANALAALALPVYHRFSFNLSAADSYLNNPSPGYKANSFQFITGITYTLH